jgi:hypothetical protein
LKKHLQKEQQIPTTETKTGGKKKNFLPVTDYKPIKKEVADNGG